MVVSLDEAKSHLRVLDCNDDAYISAIISAAESYVATYLNRSLDTWDEESPPSPVPTAVKQAILLIIGDFYENREAQGDKQYYANPAVQNLLHFHRLDIGV